MPDKPPEACDGQRQTTPLVLAPLDHGVALSGKALREYGIETFESCEGGKRHPYAEAAVPCQGRAPSALGR